jgi:hypothetical protein
MPVKAEANFSIWADMLAMASSIGDGSLELGPDMAAELGGISDSGGGDGWLWIPNVMARAIS